jgi:hypothetical protein
VLNHSRLTLLLICGLCASAACSRGETAEHVADGESAPTGANGDDASISTVRAGARALAQPEASVDYVAAEMEGVIKARTKSQALMHYDGYRVTLTTPGDRVTTITFQLIEAKPTLKQLTEVFGEPQEVRKGMLYEYESVVTGSTIVILAEPVSMPADEGSLVRRIVIEGARTR